MFDDLEHGWRARLEAHLATPAMAQLAAFVAAEYRCRPDAVYPRRDAVFRAFQLTPIASVRVVILGQDPYHGAGQATGLGFAVPADAPRPPSLRNVFRELHDDLGGRSPSNDLEAWARQGVLLLNATLTVRAGEPMSHRGRGWEAFTDAALETLARDGERRVFMLWGAHAQAKAALIDDARHLVLRAPHPSPLSAHRGFFGCRHFSRANEDLERRGERPIAWCAE